MTDLLLFCLLFSTTHLGLLVLAEGREELESMILLEVSFLPSFGDRGRVKGICSFIINVLG